MSEEKPLIVQLFPEDWEIKETSSAYKTECPDCGMQGGRTQGFILYPDTNTWSCHSSNKWGGMLELVAILNNVINCRDCNEPNEKRRILDKDLYKETIKRLIENYDEELYEKIFKFLKIKDNHSIDKNPDEEETDKEEEITTAKEEIDFNFITNLIIDTEHLQGFDLMDLDLGLDGDNYKALKKGLYYYQNSLRQDTSHYTINYKTTIDNRTHILIFTSPGAGKSTIKNQNKRIMKDLKETDGVIEVSGVSHPEQLVGKIEYKGKTDNKVPIIKMGILGYKCVMNDETQEMLNEKNDVYAKSQRLKRLAMDTYTFNKISKKLVADSPKDVLEYYSPSNMCDFAHPVQLESPFFDTGSFRRYYAYNVDNNPIIQLNDVTDFSFDIIQEKKQSWKEFLDELYTNEVDVKFTEEILKIVSHYHKCLLYYLLKHKNKNVFRYGLLVKYAMRVMFCKNIYILAKNKHEETPSLYTTLSACNDTVLFILKTIETYNELGNLGTTSDTWGGVSEQDAQALEYLYRKKALNKETSNITIKQFQTILGYFYGCKRTQSRSHHYRLKSKGYINSGQKGQYGSVVWLKYIPKDIELNTQGFDPLKFWDSYFQGASSKNTFLDTLKQHFKDDKTFEKSQGDGGVGVLGCTIIKNHICVEVDKNKNKNKYIYRYPPTTDTLGTLTPNPPKQGVEAPETPVQGAKSTKKRLAPSKPKTDREVQFYEADECKHIKPNHTADDVLFWLKDNPGSDSKKLYDRFGVGCFKFRNELLQQGKIAKEGKGYFYNG
jgi:hypothetical protein